MRRSLGYISNGKDATYSASCYGADSGKRTIISICFPLVTVVSRINTSLSMIQLSSTWIRLITTLTTHHWMFKTMKRKYR